MTSAASRLRSKFQNRQSKLPFARRRLHLESLESRELLALVSYWSGDNTAVDPISGNDGTHYNGATYAAGQAGQAFSFDGVNDRINVADSPSLRLTQSMTIEGWVRVDGFPAYGGVVLFRGDDRGGLDPYQLATTPNGTIKFLINSLTQGASVEAPIPQGPFVHVTATLDDATGAMKLYENGVLMVQTTTTIRPFADLDPASNPGVGIGNHGGYPTTPHNFPFNGRIDELKLYDHALTAAEVLANFNATKTAIYISDATAIEGSSAMKYLDRFVEANSGGLARPRSSVFGPDANDDGAQDLYVVSADTSMVLLYDGETGAFLRTFVEDSGRLLNPGDIAFGSDGNLYVTSQGFPTGTPVIPGAGTVLRYNATTGVYVDTIMTGLTQPLGVTVSGDGTVYAASQDTDEVFRRTSGGVTSVFISGSNSPLNQPRNILIGPDVTGDNIADLYVSSQSYDGVLRYNGDTGAFIDNFAQTGLGTGPAWIEFAPDGTLAATALTTTTCCNISYVRFDKTTGAKIDQVDFTNMGWRLSFGPDGFLYNGFLTTTGESYISRFGPSSLLAFSVNLSAPSTELVTVAYDTVPNSADAGDFVAASGTITFAPGQTSRTILVQTIPDTAAEANETFNVVLSPLSGGVISDGTGVGTIRDDDTKFYVVDDGSANRTFEYNASGNALENYAVAAGNSAPRGAASTAAGDKVWVVDANRNVYVYRPDGTLKGSWSVSGFNSSAQFTGIAVSGNTVWIVDAKSDKVYRFDNAAGLLSGSKAANGNFALSNGNKDASDLVTDGTSIWVLNNASTDKVFKYTIGGTLVGSWTINGGGGSPTGITIDPNSVSNIWIVDNSSDRVYQFDAAASRTSGSQSPSMSFALASGNTNPQGIANPPALGGQRPEIGGRSNEGGHSPPYGFDAALLDVVSDLEAWLGGKRRR